MQRGNGILVNEKVSMVTPLVDLLFNLMIAMFIFLMIYMAVVIPRDDEEIPDLKFADLEMPAAGVQVPYTSSIRIIDGSGDFLFLFGGPDGARDIERDSHSQRLTLPALDRRSEPNHVEARLDTDKGLLEARFFPGALGNRNQSGSWDFEVVVVDRKRLVPCPPEAPRWGAIRLFFHQETESPDSAASEIPSGELRSGGRDELCHVAIRDRFSIEVTPRSVPHRLPPLELGLPERIHVPVGTEFSEYLSVVGGLEPYEMRLSSGPPWLNLDSSSGRLSGIARRAGTFDVEIEIKDAQTIPGDWNAARQQQSIPSRPFREGILSIEADPPLGSASLRLPPYGRLGEPVRGAVTVEGGFGTRSFREVSLPPGLSISSSSGEISGRPQQEGEFTVEIEVIDQTPDSATATTVRAVQERWRVVSPRPARAVLSGGGSTP